MDTEKEKWTKKKARAFASDIMDEVLDSLRGITDPDYNLSETDLEDLICQNISEDIEENGFKVTDYRVSEVYEIYLQKAKRVRESLFKFYSNTAKLQHKHSNYR